jgi:hypothetical protein
MTYAEREAFRAMLAAKLAAPPEFAARVEADWQPIVDFYADARKPPEPMEDEVIERYAEERHARLARRIGID